MTPIRNARPRAIRPSRTVRVRVVSAALAVLVTGLLLTGLDVLAAHGLLIDAAGAPTIPASSLTKEPT